MNRDALREFLDGLDHPLYYLDFETINPAILPWDNTRPYQQIPFQFSLHIVGEPGAKPVDHGILDLRGKPWRPQAETSMSDLVHYQ